MNGGSLRCFGRYLEVVVEPHDEARQALDARAG